MKAAVIEKAGSLTLKTIPIPDPQHGQILLQVHTCSLCHSDIHILNGELKTKFPLVPSHEGAGVVAKVGPGVTHLKVGDRVGSAWLHDACGACDHCLSGWENVCVHQKEQTGFRSDGCFAEYALANANYVAALPPGLPFEEASPILCAGVTAYKGLKETEVRAGQWVAIVGASGGLGHLAVQYARVMGMKVLAVEEGKEKVGHCVRLGALAVVDASGGDVVRAVRRESGGGVHGALVLAPSVKAYEDAARYLRPRGVMVGVGLAQGQFKVDVGDWIAAGKTLRGSVVGSRLDLKEALEIAAMGGVKSEIQVKPLEEIKEVMEEMKKGMIKGRVVLRIAKL